MTVLTYFATVPYGERVREREILKTGL